MFRIDESTFKSTAKVVFAINETMREKYDNPDHVQSFMESMAWQYCKDGGFFSTGGFCLSAYDCANGDREVVATIMTYTVEKYIERQNKAITSMVLEIAA